MSPSVYSRNGTNDDLSLITSSLSISKSTNHETTQNSNRFSVRIVNQATQRYKDLLVESRADLSVFDAIYNCKAVKEANVRKWDAATAKKVKDGSMVIKCVVADPLYDAPPPLHVSGEYPDIRVLSLLEMKSMSTKHLAELASEGRSTTEHSSTIVSGCHRIALYLQCLDKSSWNSHQLSNRGGASLDHYGSKPGTESVTSSSGTITRSKSSRSLDTGAVSLPPAVVKELFPYHIVFEESFRIAQVGVSVSKLFGENVLVGRSVCELLSFTNPIPMEGLWSWSVLESLMGRMIFLEPVNKECNAKVKGTLIEVAPLPHRRMMLTLFPDANNLSELTSMNLTMTDLPIHSCQRDAVLVGEHSASEVKLTHHLDQRHRDLINSMEKQIEDRTRELANANRDLERANSELERHAARQLEHFACMSHEIRTPLNCIVGMTSLIMDTQDQMIPAHAEAVQMISGSGELLRAVVDDVLDFAKLESGSFETVIRPTDLQKTLDTVVHSIAQKFREKNITLRTYYGATVPRIFETDSRRLQQVLYNLLGNAGKFSQPSSFIDLTVSLVAAEEKGSSVRKLRFSVKDYGKGIRKEDFDRIFQPFSQASKETQTVYGGTGLGLSIASKLVSRLGGTIGLDSEEGKFAKFTIDLPFCGDPLDVELIKETLSKTSLLLIEPRRGLTHYHSFPVEVVDHYNLSLQRFSSCDDLKATLRAFDQTEQHFTLLVHEDLYEADTLQECEAALGPDRCNVLTYGPGYKVASTEKTAHFTSLSKMLPSALLQSIADHLDPQSASEVVDIAERSDGDAKSSAKQMRRSDLRVLYAEDNRINQKVLLRVLQNVGVTNVDIVDNGAKAVDITATKEYDIIFMDMQMPVMDGLDATRLIMERDQDSHVVFVTAHALDEFKGHADAVGAKGFISKPFQRSDIEKLLVSLGCSS